MVITNDQIQTRLKEIAADLNKLDELTILIVLTGGVYVGVDLSRYIEVPCRIEFIKASSYGNNRESSRNVMIDYISTNSLGKNTLIVDDIYDTGHTIKAVKEYIEKYCTYENIYTMALLEKPARKEISMNIDYIGFTIENNFVYGYGMDVYGYERNKKDIQVKENE